MAAWRSRRRLRLAAAALLLVAGVVLVAALAGRDGTRTFAAPSLADAVPYDGRSPREPAGEEQRVLVELRRPALGAVADLESLDGAGRRAYVASLRRERQALRGALAARGVRLREVVGFERTWNGFAATVRTRDLPAIGSLGVRAQGVRRFFASVGEPVPTGDPVPGGARPAGPPIALLAGGVLGGSGSGLVAGYDAVDRDATTRPEPDPRDPRRRETSGETLARTLVGAGRRVRPIRITALQAGDGSEHATTDTLLAGLERAVDPNADGDPEDADRVALVGVHAPYAGFASAPEAEATIAAQALGTLVVAPAGHEGPARPPSGTVGSPAAASRALAVGALAAPVASVELLAPGLRIRRAAALGGAPPREPGRVAIVRAGANPGVQAATAARRGARAVVLAEPRERRPLAAMPAGRVPVPVVGVTGAAARAVLELDAKGAARVAFGAPRAGRRGAPAAASPFASRGPSLDGAPKPDLAAPATTPAGATGGAGVAAALVAAEAARLAAERPAEPPSALAQALVAAADPGGRESPRLDPAAAGAGALRPPGGARPATTPTATATPAATPAPPSALGVGPLALTRRGRAVTGVRFVLGAFDRGDPLGAGATYQPVARLDLDLVDPRGEVVRRLTPPGGARGLLPAEYAYALDPRTRRALPSGRLAFRVRARAPRQAGTASERASAPFTTG